MASSAHNIISALVVRSMQMQGFIPMSADVKETLFGRSEMPTTRIIGRHRPDIIGFRAIDNRICIGEAKTKNDIKSPRTREEIEDFSSLDNVDLFLGFPSDSESEINDILMTLNLFGSSKIHLISVRKELLADAVKQSIN